MGKRRHQSGSRIFGLLLILAGSVWIMEEAGIGYFIRGSVMVWVLFLFGLFIMISGFTQNRKRLVFWGVVMVFASSVRLLQEFRIIHPYLIDVWPLYIGVVGIAFLSTLLVKPVEFAALIPGGIFVISGAYMFMEVNGFFPYSMHYDSNRILAIFLILIGSLLLWKKPRKKLEKEEAKQISDDKTSSGKANI